MSTEVYQGLHRVVFTWMPAAWGAVSPYLPTVTAHDLLQLIDKVTTLGTQCIYGQEKYTEPHWLSPHELKPLLWFTWDELEKMPVDEKLARLFLVGSLISCIATPFRSKKSRTRKVLLMNLYGIQAYLTAELVLEAQRKTFNAEELEKLHAIKAQIETLKETNETLKESSAKNAEAAEKFEQFQQFLTQLQGDLALQDGTSIQLLASNFALLDGMLTGVESAIISGEYYKWNDQARQTFLGAVQMLRNASGRAQAMLRNGLPALGDSAKQRQDLGLLPAPTDEQKIENATGTDE